MNNDWKETPESLTKLFTFKDFQEAMEFVLLLAVYAESVQHHPQWTNSYNRVEILLTTHDAGNIVTEKDHRFAEQADLIANKVRDNKNKIWSI